MDRPKPKNASGKITLLTYHNNRLQHYDLSDLSDYYGEVTGMVNETYHAFPSHISQAESLLKKYDQELNKVSSKQDAYKRLIESNKKLSEDIDAKTKERADKQAAKQADYNKRAAANKKYNDELWAQYKAEKANFENAMNAYDDACKQYKGLVNKKNASYNYYRDRYDRHKALDAKRVDYYNTHINGKANGYQYKGEYDRMCKEQDACAEEVNRAAAAFQADKAAFEAYQSTFNSIESQYKSLRRPDHMRDVLDKEKVPSRVIDDPKDFFPDAEIRAIDKELETLKANQMEGSRDERNLKAELDQYDQYTKERDTLSMQLNKLKKVKQAMEMLLPAERAARQIIGTPHNGGQMGFTIERKPKAPLRIKAQETFTIEPTRKQAEDESVQAEPEREERDMQTQAPEFSIAPQRQLKLKPRHIGSRFMSFLGPNRHREAISDRSDSSSIESNQSIYHASRRPFVSDSSPSVSDSKSSQRSEHNDRISTGNLIPFVRRERSIREDSSSRNGPSPSMSRIDIRPMERGNPFGFSVAQNIPAESGLDVSQFQGKAVQYEGFRPTSTTGNYNRTVKDRIPLLPKSWNIERLRDKPTRGRYIKFFYPDEKGVRQRVNKED